MTSWKGNLFHVTGLLCGESTGSQWSATRVLMFIWCQTEQSVEQTVESLVIGDATTLIGRHCYDFVCWAPFHFVNGHFQLESSQKFHHYNFNQERVLLSTFSLKHWLQMSKFCSGPNNMVVKLKTGFQNEFVEGKCLYFVQISLTFGQFDRSLLAKVGPIG